MAVTVLQEAGPGLMMAAPHALAGRKILIVEDEAMVAVMIEDMLEALGCVVVDVAGAVRAGLAVADDEQIVLDGAVLDVNLGGGEKVFPVAMRLAARGVPFIFSTGYGAQGIETPFAQAPVLAKPYASAELEEALTSVLS